MGAKSHFPLVVCVCSKSGVGKILYIMLQSKKLSAQRQINMS